MARGGGGNGNTGSPNTVLVVFLVLFVLLSIGLGVTTYVGFDGQTQLTSDRDKAVSDKRKADGDVDFYRFQALLCRSALGEKLNDDDQKALSTLKGRFDGNQIQTTDTHKDDASKAMNALVTSQALKFDPKENRFSVPYSDLLKNRDTDVAKLTEEVTKLTDKVKEVEKELEDNKEALTVAKNDYSAGLAKNVQDNSNALKQKLNEKENLRQKLADLAKENEELQAKIGQMTEDNEKQVAKLSKQMRDLEATVAKLQGQVSVVNILDYDQPKGKITEIDRTGTMPFINLGSADNLKQGITFSVYGVGLDGKPIAHDVMTRDGQQVIGPDGKPEKEGKGSVEVLAVLGPHQSQVRVTSVRDLNRDPILRGDLLFNPTWNPSLQQHVAIAGLIDLTGTGRDELSDLMRLLEKNRVVVDAYLDLGEAEIKGKGITRQTDFLILGEVPEIPGAATAKEDDPRAKRQQALIEARTKMQEDANRNGVTVISLRKFLTMSGYKVAKPTVNADVDLPGYRPPLQSKPAEKPPMPENKPNGDMPPKL